jgi:hypothetical protein
MVRFLLKGVWNRLFVVTSQPEDHDLRYSLVSRPHPFKRNTASKVPRKESKSGKAWNGFQFAKRITNTDIFLLTISHIKSSLLF